MQGFALGGSSELTEEEEAMMSLLDDMCTRSGVADLNGRNFSEIQSRYKRSEEHTSELQSLMRISYAVFCLKKKKNKKIMKTSNIHTNTNKNKINNTRNR